MISTSTSTAGERRPIDFALEFAGYLEAAAMEAIESLEREDRIRFAIEQGSASAPDLELALAHRSESVSKLRRSVFEFRKRAARAAVERTAAAISESSSSADAWARLYRLAVNEANGLTNYVEDRPELRQAERRLEAIERDARALQSAAQSTITPGGKTGPELELEPDDGPEERAMLARIFAASQAPAARPDDSQLPRIVFEAIGEASMQWIPRPSSARFDSTGATAVAEKLIADIRAVYQATSAPKQADAPADEQAAFEAWCPYRGNPDPRVVWAAAFQAGRAASAPAAPAPLTRLEVEMNLWPRLRLQEVEVTLHDLLTIVAATGLLAAAPKEPT